MATLGTYVEIEYQKDLISQLLKQAFINIDSELYEEMTELVFAKIHQMNQVRALLADSSGDIIEKTAGQYGASTDNVLDSFMYFTLVVENAMLMKQLAECIAKNE